ncbi:MAG: tripartite tricarboxylate transporter permease [Tepidanaerobacteraceae bacterium]
MPGLSATMAIAILLPITFGMNPATGLSMLAALYMGAMYGGSIAAILIRTPGTPAAATTVMDGLILWHRRARLVKH